MCPNTGSPESPITVLSPLSAGAGAIGNWFHLRSSNRFSMTPMPGMVTGVGVRRRLAWSSR